MNTPLADEKRLTTSIEDWNGAALQSYSSFEVRRAFNGIVVLPTMRLERTTVDDGRTVLAFQDMSHFWDWFQGWIEKTGVQR